MDNRLEQLEYLRERANVSYEEGERLLNEFNGDITRVLILLEKQGRTKHSNKKCSVSFLDRVKEFYNKHSVHRITMKKDGKIIFNISLIMGALITLCFHKLVFVGAIISLIVGCKFGFEGPNKNERNASLEKIDL